MTQNRTLSGRHLLPPRAVPIVATVVAVAVGVVFAGVSGYSFLQQRDRVRREADRITTLTKACDNYKTVRGQWPSTLEGLFLQDWMGGPYVDPTDDLKDLWGKPYHYNPQGPNNGGRRPDIWSDSSGTRIGNW
jgi:hypothetical protein